MHVLSTELSLDYAAERAERLRHGRHRDQRTTPDDATRSTHTSRRAAAPLDPGG